MSHATAPAGTYAPLIKEFETELASIADWWVENAIDTANGGFVGEIDLHGIARPGAGKGGILHARILWFFSETARFIGNEKYRRVADVAYDYLTTYFWDEEHQGIYWEVDYRGKVVDSKKHVYAQSFAIYALSAYRRLTGSVDALDKALALYRRIENSACDSASGGYREAFNRAWEETGDYALSAGEPNFSKTMNTHLHLFEAFTALYGVSRHEDIGASLRRLLDCFIDYFVNAENFHLRMYLDDAWRDCSTSRSYGHDIECSWLLWESAEVIGDGPLTASLAPVVVGMANACLKESLGGNGEILDGYDLKEMKQVESRPWWAQAEALVGFLNAYSMTNDARYFHAFENVWSFVNKYQKDKVLGEWHWFSSLDEEKSPYKAGFWKAPYHNGRAMLEVCRRLRRMEGVAD